MRDGPADPPGKLDMAACPRFCDWMGEMSGMRIESSNPDFSESNRATTSQAPRWQLIPS